MSRLSALLRAGGGFVVNDAAADEVCPWDRPTGV